MILRSYSYTARISHFCDRCFHCIESGQRYHADVIAMCGHIIVMKSHDVCPVDPFEEERELMKIIEEWEEREQDEEFELPLAA